MKQKKHKTLVGGVCKNCGSYKGSGTFKNYISDLSNELSGGGYSVNLFGENLISWVLLQPKIQKEFTDLVTKTIDDETVKYKLIDVL